MRTQSIVKTTHIWIGLIFGAFLCVTCLSGSIVAFRPELEALFSPKVAPSDTRANLDDAATRVLASHPGATLTRVLLPTASRNSFVLTLDEGQKSPRRIVVDAGTGAVAGEMNVAWLDWIVDLHHNLLSGKFGRQAVGVVGIILFAVSASGLVLSLLRRVSWKSMVTVRSNGLKRRFYFELHRATGLWAYAFLTLLSFTGIVLAFPGTFHSVFGKPTAIPKLKNSQEQAFRSLNDYLSIGRAAEPSGQLTELRLPKSPKGTISVRFRMASDLGTVGRNEISMDAAGRLLGVRRVADEPAGVRLQTSFTPIHYVEVGGLAVKAVWGLAGVAPTILFITGLLFWFGKTKRRGIAPDAEQDAAEDARELSLPLRS